MRAISFHNIVDRSSGVTRILKVGGGGRWWGSAAEIMLGDGVRNEIWLERLCWVVGLKASVMGLSPTCPSMVTPLDRS